MKKLNPDAHLHSVSYCIVENYEELAPKISQRIQVGDEPFMYRAPWGGLWTNTTGFGA